MARRSTRRLRLGNPVNLGPEVNSTLFDAAPELTRKRGRIGPLLYFARGVTNTSIDIYVSEQAGDGSFGTPTLVTELSTACQRRADLGSLRRARGLLLLEPARLRSERPLDVDAGGRFGSVVAAREPRPADDVDDERCEDDDE